MLTPKKYKKRLIEGKITSYLKTFGAVCIDGPKWCGKTWTSLHHSESVCYLADPEDGFANRTKANINPAYVLDGKTPRLIDEWQEVPEIWDAVRFSVDKKPEKGQFILTDSSTPVRKGILHSGAGRIGIVHMQTMSLYETGDSTGQVSLGDLFTDTLKTTLCKKTDLKELIYFCIRGGWPANMKAKEKEAALAAKEYLNLLLDNDIENPGGIRYDKRKLHALLHSLARNESTVVSNATLRSDMLKYDETSADPNTISTYLDILFRLFLIEEQPSFNPHLRSSRRILTSPKRHFTDPSLAAAALQATPEMLFDDLKTFGFLFEALCEHDLKIYADVLGGTLYHYRDAKGKEIDAVIELENGVWGGFEIKLGAHQVDEAAENLIAIRSIIEKEEGTAPAFLCVLCGTADIAYKRKDGVFVVPLTSLGP
ncbi:MAG TPA: DUF4143 domain-containing protein [Methanocorpusculum sp.]|nr:DUF4143 domain-containing protein [Methanocorpusculum sp.]